MSSFCCTQKVLEIANSQLTAHWIVEFVEMVQESVQNYKKENLKHDGATDQRMCNGPD